MNDNPNTTAKTLATQATDTPTLKFDRRRSARHVTGGHVTMLRRNQETLAYRHPVCSIQLTDMSDSGAGARSDVPLIPNEPVAVFIPPHGNERGFDLYGHVVRCEPTRQGYAVGIAFDLRPAA